MARNSKTGGENASDTVLNFLRNLKRDTSSTPRMLTPSEQESLRTYKSRIHDQVAALLGAHGGRKAA